MATVRTSDLLSKLVTKAQTSLTKADANRSGTISASEVRGLPTSLGQEFASYQRQVSSVRVSEFVSAFSSYAQGQLTRADANRDGLLSSAELSSISGMLKDNVLEILGTLQPTVTPTPITPTPVTPSPVTPAPSGTGVFGISGTIPASRVKLVPLLTQGLNKPTAMAFDRQGSLWIVNQGDDSSIIVDNPGTRSQKAQKFRDDSAHFMNNPMAIAFSRGKDEFATVQDTTNDYNGMHMGNMFMGPTLWSANRRTYEGGTNSHIDMLHSPNSVGIAAGLRPSGTDKREYWVFDGNTGSIDRYYFNKPHELGGDNHLDGETYRYAAGQLRMVPNVPGHMDIDSKGTLFICDTGNGRIATFDTTKASTAGRVISAYHDETPLVGAQGPSTQTFASGLNAPSGLILKGGNVIVGEYGTGHIKVFGPDGKLKGDLDTGMGARALTGLCESKNGTIYALNQRSGQLVEVQIG